MKEALGGSDGGETAAERVQAEGMWLNDKLAVPGLSNVSPLNKMKGAKPKPPPKATVATGFTPLKPLKAVKPIKPIKPKPPAKLA